MKINGITLLALVITVVIIIILATISINFLFGEDGIISKAEEARKMMNIESVREELEMAKASEIAVGKEKTTIDEVMNHPKIEVLFNEDLVNVDGEDFMQKAIIKNTEEGGDGV